MLTAVHGPAGELMVDDGGTGGLPVLFVHPLCGNATYWSAQLEHLRQTRRAAALDLRGHGRSQAPSDNDYSLDSLSADIDAVVDSIGLDRFVLVGHSIGGSVVLDYAGLRPQRVSGLLLVDATADVRQLPLEQKLEFTTVLESEGCHRFIENFWEQFLDGSSPLVRERVLTDMHRAPRELIAGMIGTVLKFNPLPPLASYKGPKFAVVMPTNDTPLSLHNLVSDLPHVTISGTGHWLQMDSPAELNRVLDSFLDTVEKA
ncbi:dihydrolipoyllysine-residue acetyltransferase component of acetoin cleaving system [Geobacter sp. OR-1]|uniref:alpha/beta fold hydrolase n=1 Tax=Geobacter sp. OR-1 TaxID=1266765 RepID=UPI000541C464|nr:alpha/beta hydrolase [Geobacter sp. OR-1]GAM10094.1 dihydrolipoyllysine-residue acetyltransferase component of acetoin cleaving system [Geobacter sp. OR-1]